MIESRLWRWADMHPSVAIHKSHLDYKPFDAPDKPCGFGCHTLSQPDAYWLHLLPSELRKPEVHLPPLPGQVIGSESSLSAAIRTRWIEHFGASWWPMPEHALDAYSTEGWDCLEPMGMDVYGAMEFPWGFDGRFRPRAQVYVCPVGRAEPFLGTMAQNHHLILTGRYAPGTGSLRDRRFQAFQDLSMVPEALFNVVETSAEALKSRVQDTMGLLLLAGEAEMERVMRLVAEMRAKDERGGRP